MSTPDTERDPREREVDESELVAEDDAIIGKAFRISMLVFAVLAGAVGLGVWLFPGSGREAPPEQPDVLPPVRPPASVEPPEVVFTDVTRESGIDFERFNGARGEKLLPETMGGGCAFFDYDTDGDQDLLLVNGAAWDAAAADGQPRPTPALYANDGAGHFAEVTQEVGLDFSFQGMGVAVGDYDSDGDPDLVLTGVHRNLLLRNDASGGFVDVSAENGLTADPERWSSSAGFFDADGDGDLDLFVCNYVRWTRAIDLEVGQSLTGVGRAYGAPTRFEGSQSSFYLNEGGHLREATAESGFEVANAATGVPVGKALGLLPIDADGDGLMDLVVANDTVQNFFYHNQGGGRFAEIGVRSGLAFGRDGNATGAMGIDAAEYRGDGTLGFAIANFANEMSSLYVSQRSRMQYTDESIVEGVGAASRLKLSFGLFFFDYDLDGRQDLLQVNGHLEDEINKVQPSQHYRQEAQLFWNAGSEARASFVAVGGDKAGDLLDQAIVGRGATYADIDADGDLDVLLTQSHGRPLLLRNDQATGHHYLRVELKGRAPNTQAIGARVEISAGGLVQTRYVMPTRSYLSQVELPVTFGLGAATRVEMVRVRWPDGSEESLQDVEADRVLSIEKKP